MSQDNSTSFHGELCCLFHFGSPGEAIQNMQTELVVDYGDTYLNPDGSVKHFLHTWDDGSRSLIKCTRCGALFLRQRSEYHGRDNDDYYTDYYQVESVEVAEQLNANFDGFTLEWQYRGPWIKRSDSSVTWNRG